MVAIPFPNMDHSIDTDHQPGESGEHPPVKIKSHHQGDGFSLIELMLSVTFILLSVAWVTRITTNAQVAVRNGNLVDSIYTSINEDADKLRKAAMDYGCASMEASSGDCLAYSTASATDASSEFYSSCISNSVAQKMLTDQASTLATPFTLVWAPNAPAGVPIPTAISAIRITRTITQDSDKGRLLVNYSTAAPSPLNISVTTIIVPQAQAWCPGPK
ncbi:MAG: hypothetical protein WCQ20_06240 [Synechococcaceae cyanobacterium ELA739]